MPRFSEKNAVFEDGVFLPKFLFYFDDQKSKSISPAAAFNPATAIDGEAFETSTKPSAKPKKKTLIIDKNSLKKCEGYGEKVALLKRLQISGFEIFLCGQKTATNTTGFCKLEKDLSNIAQLHSLRDFDEEIDYNALAKLNVARDKTLLLCEPKDAIQSHVEDITEALGQRVYPGEFFGDALRCEFWDSDSDSPPSVATRALRPKCAAFTIAHSKEEKRGELLKTYQQNKARGTDTIDNSLEYVIGTIPERFWSDYSITAAPSLSNFKILCKIYPNKAPSFREELFRGDEDLQKFSELIKNESIRSFLLNLPIDGTNWLMYLRVSNAFKDLLKALYIDRNADQLLKAIQEIPSYDFIPDKKFRNLLVDAIIDQGLHSEKLIRALKQINFLDRDELGKSEIQKIDSNTDTSDFTTRLKPAKHKANQLSLRTRKDIRNAITTGGYDRPYSIERDNLIIEAPFLTRDEINLIDHDYKALEAKPTFIDFAYVDFESEFYAINYNQRLSSPKIDRLKQAIEDGYFSNAAVIRIPPSINIESYQNCLELFKGKAQIRHLIAPLAAQENFLENEDLLEYLKDQNISYEFFDYENYLGIKDIYAPFIEARRARKQEVNPPPQKNQIRLAQSKASNKLDVENNPAQTFQMALAGEVLNNSTISPQIRNTIIERNILENLDQKEYVPSDFQKVENIKNLKASDIDGFKTINTSEIYYKFDLELVANKKCRLPSADAAEEFMGILGDAADVEIAKGDDDFFYATARQNRDFSYVVKAPNPQIDQQKYNGLASSNPIKKIIDKYRSAAAGFAHVASSDKENVNYDEKNHAASMQRMFEERSGVCRHRVAAVEYTLRTEGVNRQDFRAVRINGNHVVLEIKADGKWIKVDLGGGAATENLLNEDQKFKATEIDDQTESNAANKNLGELKDLAKVGVDSDLTDDDRDISDEKPVTNPNHDTKSEDGALAFKSNAVVTEEGLAKQEARIQQELKNKALKAMATSLLTISELGQINSEDGLKTKTIQNDKNKILVVSDEIEKHANFLLREAAEAGRKIFYIDSPSKIDLHRTNLLIANDNSPALSRDGLLSGFLQNAAQNPKQSSDKRPLLVINWSAFSSKQKVALNTVLDIERSINGEKIDDSIQVIGLASKASQDPSFLSRHDLSFESQISQMTIVDPDQENSSAKTTIDLQGFSNWRRHLFGKVVLNNGQMEWQKSDLVRALEEKKDNFEIVNLSPKDIQSFEKELAQAKAAGKFIYHGREIAVPKNIKISFGSKGFDFDKFQGSSKVSVLHNATFNQSPEGCALINTQLFDQLLCDKKIENGNYSEEIGLIEKCRDADGDKVLPLFISSDLSDGQWYCLFNEAQKHDVKLELFLAPKVKISSGVKASEGNVAQDNNGKIKATIVVSNDPDKVLRHDQVPEGGICESKTDERVFEAVVDVEDCTYQDLIEKIEFSVSETGFEEFKKTESQFLEKLKKGKKITLKGQFSPDLLQMLEPILTQDFAKNLTLIIEDKKCQNGTEYEPLNWLGKGKCEVQSFEEDLSRAPATDRLFIEESDASADLKNSEAKSKEFIKTRKDKFSETLQNHNMLRLIGHSGVGKSRLLKEFEENDADTTAVYRELSDFENWANDNGGKTKILFIDESNIEDRHFTTFSPLKNNGENTIFYQGKFYTLGDKHKVVFAQNPTKYGGGRFEQKLFDDGKISVIELRDFPASYIYEKILKQAIYDGFDGDIKERFSEGDFKEVCQLLIEEYQETNSRKKSDQDANEETVRELQEKVLEAVCNFLDGEAPTISSKNFISTNATKEVEAALSTALNIRQKQRSGEFSNNAVGLNGVLLEGDSGTGKSELIAAMLAAKNISEKKLNETSNGEQQFYKMDASLPLAQKKQLIVKAFEEGNIIWIDEINSCIDDGLEKVLNAALTGDHPEGNRDKEITPGFMLISSVNSAGLEGRSLISPALRHRTTQPRVKSLRDYPVDDLAKIIENWLNFEKEDSATFVAPKIRSLVCQNIAKDFAKCLRSIGGEDLNLRMLRGKLEEILPSYVELAGLEEAAVKKKNNEARVLTPKEENLGSEVNASIFQPDDAGSDKNPQETVILSEEVPQEMVISPEAEKVLLILHESVKKHESTIFFQGASGRGNKLRVICDKKNKPIYVNKEAVESALKNVILMLAKDLKINAKEMGFIFEYAKINGGFSNKFVAGVDEGSYCDGVSDLKNYIKEKLELGDQKASEKVLLWQKFSRKIQDSNAKIGIYSGREVNLKTPVVGLRAAFALDLVGDAVLAEIDTADIKGAKKLFSQNSSRAKSARRPDSKIIGPETFKL